MFTKVKTLFKRTKLKRSKSQMDKLSLETKSSDIPMKTSDIPVKISRQPIIPSDIPMDQSDKPFKASDSPVKAKDKSVKQSDLQMKSSDISIKASRKKIKTSEIPTKVSEKPMKTSEKSIGKAIKILAKTIKEPSKVLKESKYSLDGKSTRDAIIAVKEKHEIQAATLDDLSESTKTSTSPLGDTSEKGSLSFVCISDTHCKLTEEIVSQIPHADVLLHAGDFTMNGTVRELIEFNKFLGLLSHKYKVVIAGNHEACLEDEMFPETRFINKHYRQKFGVEDLRELLTNCTYIQDELIEISGIKIYGSPWTQKYSVCDAFSLCSTESLQRRWEKIPDNIDILMTHGPPRGFGDTTTKQVSAGCSILLREVQNRVKPRYHVFGHIHEGYGIYKDENTTFINAAMCTRGYKPTNRPVKFRLNIPRSNSCDTVISGCLNHTSLNQTGLNHTDCVDFGNWELEN